MARVVDVDQTRREIRHTFALWDIDPSEFEIIWEEERDGNRVRRLPGAKVRYLRNGQWQEIFCFVFPTRARNLRQIFLLLDRLRIAEQQGVQYQGLTYSKDLATTTGEAARRESLMDAFDILGASFDDPTELIKDIFRKKSSFFHPDNKVTGDEQKMKRLNNAYELIMKSRGAT